MYWKSIFFLYALAPRRLWRPGIHRALFWWPHEPIWNAVCYVYNFAAGRLWREAHIPSFQHLLQTFTQSAMFHLPVCLQMALACILKGFTNLEICVFVYELALDGFGKHCSISHYSHSFANLVGIQHLSFMNLLPDGFGRCGPIP